MSEPLLDLQHVSRTFRIGGLILGTPLVAVDDVSLRVPAGRPMILSIVGESGSGKTTLARMILRLVAPTGGRVLLRGQDVTRLSGHRQLLAYRRTVQPVFQNPFESFSAHRTVDCYLFETAQGLRIARTRNEARSVVARAVASVGMTLEGVAGKYPHQFSGGELQRISVARALIPGPALLVADEPVGMIDASLRMNIVNAFVDLKQDVGVSIIYITHDLSTASYISDAVAIMFRGTIVEYGPAAAVLESPRHPYTQLLLESVPRIGAKWDDEVPAAGEERREYELSGCRFADRCPHVTPECRAERPADLALPDGRRVACIHHERIFGPVPHADELHRLERSD